MLTHNGIGNLFLLSVETVYCSVCVQQLSNEYEDKAGIQEFNSFHPNAWCNTAVTVKPPPPAMRSATNTYARDVMQQFRYVIYITGRV